MGEGGSFVDDQGQSDTAAVAFLADCKMIVHVKLLTQFQYSISVECCCMDSKIFLTAWSEINGLCHIHQGATARKLLQPGWCYILCYGHIFLLIGETKETGQSFAQFQPFACFLFSLKNFQLRFQQFILLLILVELLVFFIFWSFQSVATLSFFGVFQSYGWNPCTGVILQKKKLKLIRTLLHILYLEGDSQRLQRRVANISISVQIGNSQNSLHLAKLTCCLN